MDRDELDAFREVVGRATSAATGRALDEALADLGWHDALAADRHTAVATLFERQGRANVTSSALDTVLADALGFAEDAVELAVVLPLPGPANPPGRFIGDGLAVYGVGSAALRRRPRAVVVTSGAKAVGAVVEPPALTVRPVEGMDPGMELLAVMATGVPTDGATDVPPHRWEAAVAAGRLALAHELVGASRGMLDLATTHARDRVQFGRPIAQFQAVRHRLAESLVAIEGAEAALGAAWDEGTPLAAALAKALAGGGARTVARHCQQVLGGIGFTAEHPFHRYLKRVLVLDQLLGDAHALTRAVGEQLLADRRLPTPVPL